MDFKLAVYDGEGTSFDDLKLGPGVRLDAILSNRPTIDAAIAKGYPFRILTPDAFAEPLAIAIDKGDPAFNAAIADAVKSLRADGTLKKLSLRWFGADLTVEQ
jgi:polar amino acid transport system substrate-binding protein